MRYISSHQVKFIGLSYEDSKLADMAGDRINNINALAEVELEDLDNEQLQTIRDIADGCYECEKCVQQAENNESMIDRLYDSFTEIRYRMNTMSDYIDNTSKVQVEKFNELVKTINEEVERIEKEVTKSLKEKDAYECCLDVKLDLVIYREKEEIGNE